jgi:hypothetical protein
MPHLTTMSFPRGFLVFALTAGSLLAQTTEFEVASIKPSPPFDTAAVMNGKMRIGVRVDAGRVEMSFLSIGDLVAAA